MHIFYAFSLAKIESAAVTPQNIYKTVTNNSYKSRKTTKTIGFDAFLV